jgi:hypothetical protein
MHTFIKGRSVLKLRKVLIVGLFSQLFRFLTCTKKVLIAICYKYFFSVLREFYNFLSIEYEANLVGFLYVPV